ncbi:MAG: hypothetical protein L7S56_08280 [Candidatus Poseidonia sp.]|nr:hypothetical protein [Poseidonia sp.]
MNTHPGFLFLMLFALHVMLGLLAYIEKRMKPLYALLQINKINTNSLTGLAQHYASIGVTVPDKLLIEPEPILTKMLRKLEARVGLEISAVLFVALIPSSVLTAILVN